MVNRQIVSELLQGHGIIPTQQRVEIAMLMLEGNQHYLLIRYWRG